MLLFASKTLFAQFGTERIEMKQHWSGYSFMVDDKKIKLQEALKMMAAVDSIAYAKMLQSRKKKYWAASLGGLGAIMMAYPLGEMLAGKKAKWPIGLAGAVLAGISIPINSKARMQANDALELYNNKVTWRHHPATQVYCLVLQPTAVGLKISL